MEQKPQSLKQLKQRKFLLVLPLLVLPFLTFLFWSLGGGKMGKARPEEAPAGLNLHLPAVMLKDEKTLTKMDYYNQAQSDSAKFRELIKHDPYYETAAFGAIDEEAEFFEEEQAASQGINSSIYGDTGQPDFHEERVYQKLAQLDQALSKVDEPLQEEASQVPLNTQGSRSIADADDITRLEQMMHAMSQPDGEDDEIRQLNGMLEKILDIQHPDRVQEKLRQRSLQRKETLFAVAKAEDSLSVSSLTVEGVQQKQVHAFYSLDEVSDIQDTELAISAVIHETQTLVNGAAVKLRLLQDVYIDGILVPSNQFLFGVASLNGERLQIKITSVLYKKHLFPVDLSVYDIDGMRGIHVPGALGREVVKESANRSIQGFGLASLDPSLEAQVTGAGIETAKKLFSRKVKLVKMTLTAGYQVLLKDEKHQ